jgi:methionine-rich copper-binding protein CopC
MSRRFFAFSVVLSLLSISAASAHTSLVSSTPSNNAMLKVSPKEIKITFNEKLVNLAGKPINRITLQDSKGKAIALAKATLNANTISVALPVLGKGSYTAKYRVVSGDGHPVTGSIKFRVTK